MRFLYNPDFIAQRTQEELFFILTNCVMHHVLAHQQRRLNRRGGFVLPSLSSDTLSLCVAIDTSGSIDEALFGSFVGEFSAIMQSFPSIKIELIIADAKVHGHYTFFGNDKLDFKIKGGGGTDYRPVFEYIEANLPMNTMLLYFTDGDGWFPKYAPNYEVLWALLRKAKIPFGRALELF